MKINSRILVPAAIALLSLGSISAHGAVDLTPFACSASPPTDSGLYVTNSDVMVGAEDAADCYGAFDRNSLGNNDSTALAEGAIVFTASPLGTPTGNIGGTSEVFEIAKSEAGGGPGALGLWADISGGTGSWGFGSDVIFDTTWMVVIKRGPCWAGWTFGAGEVGGGNSFDINFGGASGGICGENTSNGWSHIAVYAGDFTELPEPGTLALLGLGLVGMGFARRRTSG